MKNLVILFVSLFVVAVATKNVNAQSTANGTASATIITPISITAKNILSFGSIAAGSSESKVVIATGGGRTVEGNATLYTNDAGQQGTFEVTGAEGHTYSITLPSDGETTLTTSGGNSMDVKTFKSDPGATGKLDDSGKQTIQIGATLVVKASQSSGTYSGQYAVTVNYN